MEEVVLSPMETFLGSMSSIGTTLLGWVGDIAGTIVSQPILLVPVGLGIFGVAIGTFKKLRH